MKSWCYSTELLMMQPRNVSAVSCFVDYYGLEAWPQLDTIAPNSTPLQIGEILNTAAKQELCREYDSLNPSQRFIPFVAIHKFEALLFSEPMILARFFEISEAKVEEVIKKCGSPEQINNSRETAPSKRLLRWNPRYSKPNDGIAIAQAIGIEKMRQACPNFDAWLHSIETLQTEE